MFARNVNKILSVFVVLLMVFTFSACENKDNKNQESYEKITDEKAKEIMDSEKEFIILDVRTEQEFSEGHIENAILIPDYEIKTRAENELTDKNKLILVYCRTGRRSLSASKALVDLGYKNVKDFGGIVNWKYDTVK